jgi:hypothetical protein
MIPVPTVEAVPGIAMVAPPVTTVIPAVFVAMVAVAAVAMAARYDSDRIPMRMAGISSIGVIAAV